MARAKTVEAYVGKSKATENKISKTTELFGIRPKTPEDIAKEIIRSKVAEKMWERYFDGLIPREMVQPYIDYVTELEFQEIKKKIPLAPPTTELNKMSPEERFRATYPAGEFNSFDEAMAYQGYIIPIFRGNKGIFNLYESRTTASEYAVSREQETSYATAGEFISVDGGILEDWNKVILFLGKAYQTVYVARVYKTSFMVSRAGFLKPLTKLFLYRWLRTQRIPKGGITFINLLKEVIPDEPFINNAVVVESIRQLHLFVQDGFDSARLIKSEELLANFENGVLPIKSNLLLVGYGGSLVYVSTIKDVRVFYFKTQDSYVDTKVVPQAQFLMSFLNNPKDKTETIRYEPIQLLLNPKYLFKSVGLQQAVELNSARTKEFNIGNHSFSELLNSETKIGSLRYSKELDIFEDDTGTVEQEEFFATPKVRDNDIYRTNLGGGADYYSGINLAGWDTLADNPTSSLVTYNRAREKQTTPFPSRKPEFETFMMLEFPEYTKLTTVPSLGELKQPQLAKTANKAFLPLDKPKDVHYSIFSFVGSEKPYQVAIDNKPVFILSDNPNRDVLYEVSVFVKREAPLNAFACNPVFVYQETPKDTFEDAISTFTQLSIPNNHLAFPIGAFSSSKIEYSYMDAVASTGEEDSSLVSFEDKVAKVFQKESSLTATIPNTVAFPVYIDSSENLFEVKELKTLALDSSLQEFLYKESEPEEDEWLPTNTWNDIKGEPATYLITIKEYPVDKGIYKLFYGKTISYIDIWRFVDYGNPEQNLWGNSKTSGGYPIPPHKDIDFVTEVALKALSWKYMKPVKHQATLMQVGYGYTSSPNVTIDATKLSKDLRGEFLPIPTTLTWDISSDRVFESPQIDTRDYKGEIILRAKTELIPFKEWIESVGEVFAFIYGVTLMYHFITPMQFERQSFLGCASKGLKIIGKLPKISIPKP